MSKTNLLEIEQRVDLDTEFLKFGKLLSDGNCTISGRQGYAFQQIIDLTFIDCPFAGTSISFDHYFSERGIYRKRVDNTEFYLYYFEFVVLYISWLKSAKNSRILISKNDNLYFNAYSSNEAFFIRLNRQISLILEMINYRLYKEEDKNHFGFDIFGITKRDADVDSVLQSVEPSVQRDILSFYDFRNEKDLLEKEAIITRLYKNVLEKDKKILSAGGTGALYGSTKRLFNYIARHYSDGEIHSNEDKIVYCNKAFKMFLHLIRSQEIFDYQNEVAKLKNQDE